MHRVAHIGLAAALLLACGKKDDGTPTPPAPVDPAPRPAPTPPPTPEEPATRVLGAGTVAPDFTTVAHDGTKIQMSALRGKPVVLYFYPKDMTPG